MYALGFDFSASVSESESKLRFAFSCCFLRTTGSRGGAGADLICVEGLPLVPAEAFSLSVCPERFWAKLSEGFAGCQVGRADAFRVETNPPKNEGRLQAPSASCVYFWPPSFSYLSTSIDPDKCASCMLPYLARPADEGGSCTAEDIYWREQAPEVVGNDLVAAQQQLQSGYRSR